MIYIVAIICLIIGLVGGFFIGIFYFKKQMEKMQNDPKMLQDMARKMGYNMNKQQLHKAQQMMKGNNKRRRK